MTKGLVISGEFGKILVREKSDETFELGELLVSDTDNAKVLLQVFDLAYGSQITQQNRELIAGMNLEENTTYEFIDESLRNYNLALLKNLITIRKTSATISKTLPDFFSTVRDVTSDDLSFLTKPANPLFIGHLRSGSKTLDVDINLPARQVLSHHILIPGTTGRGKSVLVSNLLWSMLKNDYAGVLVLDPHDEYYGRNSLGLKDHPSKNVVYYTPRDPPPNSRTMRINLACLRPHHFYGIIDWSDPQQQALTSYFRHYKKGWIEAILLDKEIEAVNFHEGTLNVVKRRLMNLLDLNVAEGELVCEGIFDKLAGATTINDIVKELESSKVVIIDTSLFSGDSEILVGSLIAAEVLSKYKHYKTRGELKDKPVISIVLEEAPRVLGKDVLERGPNIFSTIAREGRKFTVGLTAITQLPSLIPREILANMNTKIVLGIEMKPERQAIIESASQDLSDDDRNIASLDKGEALITSNFIKFATPVKIPFFDDIAKNDISKSEKYKKSFGAMKLT
jgi:DNA helicase HerA-like ATPase